MEKSKTPDPLQWLKRLRKLPDHARPHVASIVWWDHLAEITASQIERLITGEIEHTQWDSEDAEAIREISELKGSANDSYIFLDEDELIDYLVKIGYPHSEAIKRMGYYINTRKRDALGLR